ncbi:MAG: hypothetical protein U9P10_05780, partial [Thermodesulfobacteriota bacterium]|nr:hypothetical protein [Thermodesulfobacteriota bacterium]
MEKSFFETNMALLEKNHNNLWKMIRETEPEPAGEIVMAENGKPNLKVETETGTELLFHHKDDPEKEAGEFLNIVPQNSRGTVIFQGMGLGYGPLAILENRENIRFLIVFELFPEIFVQALHALDLTDLLSDPRVIISIGENPQVNRGLGMAARAMRLEDVSMLKHVPSFQYDKIGYENLSTAVYHTANEFNISANTFKAYGDTFISNRLSFLSMINHTSLCDSLSG